ncbi:MAG: tetratricopeptide repeat protein [Pseudomonadota bacterium]|nr:tetratricopeptide repeat protein [Pseudomonadota bacterium]
MTERGRIERARGLLLAGDIAGARLMCETCLLAPSDASELAGAHLILAACSRRQGDQAAMLAHATSAVTATPDDALAHYALAECADEAGDKARAIAELRRAIERDANMVQAQRYLGALLLDAGNVDLAVVALQRAVALDETHAEAWNNLGTALHRANRLADAEAAYRRALALKPEYPRAVCNLAVLQRDQGRADLAEETLRALIVRQSPATAQQSPTPGHPLTSDSSPPRVFRPALTALADLLRARGELDEAAELYLRAAKLAPDASATEMLDLGMVLSERGDPVQARKAFGVALRQNPGYLRAALAMNLTLPMIYTDAADVARARDGYVAGLETLERELDQRIAGSDWRQVIDGLTWSNFFLAYQGEDDKALQSRYASLAARALDGVDRSWRERIPVEPAEGRRIRVGFVSALLRECTVGRYFARWLTDLDREQFEVYFYPLSAGVDAVTNAISTRADRVRAFGGGDAMASTIAPIVRSDHLDVLLYPELGMDQATFALASMRLAPRQYAAWGHPVTTGHATIDAFLSCAAMEPEGADAHYTEKLIRLPGIGTRFRRQTLPSPIERETFSLPREATLLLCPQSLFKIHPDNDALLARVLCANPQAVLVLFAGRHPAVTDQFMRRLARCFDGYGLPIRERTRVLPQLPHDDYLAVNLACDAMLDTLRWSGGHTSVDALDCGLPVVTLPGAMMRGRQSAGMLSLLGLHELIAIDTNDYVRIATRLCQDPGWRTALAGSIRERNGRLFDDPAPLDALQALCREAASVPVG